MKESERLAWEAVQAGQRATTAEGRGDTSGAILERSKCLKLNCEAVRAKSTEDAQS